MHLNTKMVAYKYAHLNDVALYSRCTP